MGLIIVNDGSEADISAGINSIKKELPHLNFVDHQVNKGKGHALKTGISLSKSKHIVYTDIDLPYTHDSMVEMINDLIQEKADVFVGIRGESYYNNIPSQRVFVSKFLKSLNKFLFSLPTSDTQGGLKAMNQKAKELFIKLETDRYLIDLEFLKKAKKHKMQIALIPVVIREGIELNEMPFSSLLKELKSFVKILFS